MTFIMIYFIGLAVCFFLIGFCMDNELKVKDYTYATIAAATWPLCICVLLGLLAREMGKKT